MEDGSKSCQVVEEGKEGAFSVELVKVPTFEDV